MASGREKIGNRKRKTTKNRPKRPLSGYLMFMKEHMRRNTNKDRREAMKLGAKKWREMAQSEKEKYNSKCSADQCRFNREMIEFSKYLENRRCPRSGYNLFMQDFYANAFGEVDRSKFFDNSRDAATLWYGLNSKKKLEYTKKCKETCAKALRFRKSHDSFKLSNYQNVGREQVNQIEGQGEELSQTLTYADKSSKSKDKYHIDDIVNEDLAPNDERLQGLQEESKNASVDGVARRSKRKRKSAPRSSMKRQRKSSTNGDRKKGSKKNTRSS